MQPGRRPVHLGATKRQRLAGFTYLWVLLSIAVVGIGLATASELWSNTARRQRMTQLDWVGRQFVQAIGSYYEATPGIIVKTYPQSLEDLLEDRRYLVAMRHLRQIYVNPFTGNADWQLLPAAQGGIRGVRVSVPSESGMQWRQYVFDPVSRLEH